MAETRVPNPQLRFVESNGISMASFEWRPELRGSAPTLLLVHATGFHARVWDRVIAHLPAWHIIAVEQRGHGRSTKTDITSWATLGRDLAGFVAALDLSALYAVGHSMGAHALVQAAAFEADRFERLMLIDPVIASPQAICRGNCCSRSLCRPLGPVRQTQSGCPRRAWPARLRCTGGCFPVRAPR